MKQMKLLLVFLATVSCMPTAQAAEEYARCSGETQECLDAMAESLKQRGWVGLDLNSRGGLEEMFVTHVVPGSPAEAAGFHEGDRLIALNGVEFKKENIAKLKDLREDQTPGKQATYRVLRRGSVRELWVTLAAMPDSLVATMVGEHMLKHTGSDKDEE
jgi:predicted metalloprotease with PDZ domain